MQCRYDFSWSPTRFIPFYGGAKYHDYHHYVGRHSQSNFASVFTYCDYLYGTDKVSPVSDNYEEIYCMDPTIIRPWLV